jgi:hypothetical protein
MEISCRWHGDTLEPLPKDMAWANEHLVVGMIYRFEPIFPRSMNSHRHQFAFIKEGFRQLPERYAKYFQNEEHLRKHLLIMEGYANVKEYVFTTSEDMRQALEFAEEASEVSKDYAIFEVDRKNLVFKRIVAQSQSVKDMPAGVFNESKRRILNRLSSMIGITPEELKANSGKAA